LRALALLICERTIIEAFTSQYNVIGTYHSIMPLAYPAVMPQMGIYVCLERGERETEDVFLALISPEGERVVRSVLSVTDWGSVGIAEFGVTFRSVPFAVPGLYVLRLFVEQRVLMERGILLQTPPPPGAGQAD
jgi:hypothetical protein